MNKIRLVGALATLSLGVALSACGDDDPKTADTKAPLVTSAAGGTTASASVKVDKPWARTSPMSSTLGAAYMMITAGADDKLVGASVESTVAGKVEIHETVMVTEGTSMESKGTEMATSGTGMSPAMTMRPVQSIELPAGTAVELKPGGYHVMLIDLVKPLKVGESFALTLTFEKAGKQTIDVPVLDAAP